jgi:hypothetical protein
MSTAASLESIFLIGSHRDRRPGPGRRSLSFSPYRVRVSIGAARATLLAFMSHLLQPFMRRGKIDVKASE